MRKKLNMILIPLLTVTVLVGCGKDKENGTKTDNDSVAVSSSKNKAEGYEDENGNFVSFKEVKEKLVAYDQSIKDEDFEKALELEAWLESNSHQNGMTPEEVERINTNHGGLVSLSRIKEAIDMAKDKEDMSTEIQALNGLKEYEEAITSDPLLDEIAKNYQKQVDDVFNELSKKTNIPREKDTVKNDRIGSGDEDYDEDGNYIDGGKDVSNDPISVDKVESSDDVYGD